jgi:ATP-dependent DNA helicase 2 subunit 2
MKRRIHQLVNDSVLTQLYPKALECIYALREGCIQEEESDAFNKCLTEMRSFYEGKRKDDFWKLIVQKRITLIDHTECEDSTVTPEEARQVCNVSTE